MSAFHELLIVMVVIWTAGKIFRLIHLPVVFGELIGGIIIGPAMLGLVHADTELITILAELGIFFLMLHAGLDSDPGQLLQASKKSVLVSIGGLLPPLIGGYLVAQWFGQSFESSLLIGIAVSVSSIPLIARMFKDFGMEKSETAHVSMGAAIINDILALILFSMVMRFSEQGEIDLQELKWIAIKTMLFFGIVIWGGMKSAPYLNKIFFMGNKGFTMTLIIALLMGLIAEAIGLHMIIGAFLAGLFMREEVIDTDVFDKIEDRVYGLSYSFFGPVFFASLAFYLDFRAFLSAPIFLGIIILVAIAGKLIGSGGAALAVGMNMRNSALIGLAMNNRGAVELVIASIALRAGIIDQTVFSILVIMAFATTVFSLIAAAPLLKGRKTVPSR